MRFWHTPQGIYYELLDHKVLKAVSVMDDYIEIDENSDDWMNGTIEQFDSWQHLYEVTHFNPLKSDHLTRVMWISPEGDAYGCDCHAEMAAWICRLIFGIPDDLDLEQYNELLTRAGWVKVSNWMWNFYSERRFAVTQSQYDTIFDWCREMGCDLPEDMYVSDIPTGNFEF